MKPSEIIKNKVQKFLPRDMGFLPDPFQKALLEYIDEEWLLEHQSHTNKGWSCKTCRDLGLVVGGNPLSDSAAKGSE